MNIYKKLNEIHKKVGYLQKTNSGKQYRYVGSSDVLASVRQHMNEENLILLPKVIDTNVREFETKTGTLQIFTELVMEMTWVNTDNPDETLTIPWYAQGMDLAGEKGVGKALTYGEKYFLMKFFNIATDNDDPDKFQERIEASKMPEKVSPEQVNALKDKLSEMKKLLETNEDIEKISTWFFGKLGTNKIENATENNAKQVIILLDRMIEKQKKEKEPTTLDV